MVSRLLTTALIVIVHGTVLHAQVERLGRVFDVRSLFEDRGIRELVMEDPYLWLPDHGLGLQLDRDQDGDEDSGQWDEERLAALIQRTIAPDSWRNTRNSIEERDGHIAVVQTPDVLEQVDSLIARGRITVDPRARQLIYDRVERLVVNDAPVVPLYTTTSAYGVRRGVYGLELTPMGISCVDLANVWIGELEDDQARLD